MSITEHQIVDDTYVSEMITIDICLQSGLLDTAEAGIRFVASWIERIKVPAEHPIRAQLYAYRRQLDELRRDPLQHFSP